MNIYEKIKEREKKMLTLFYSDTLNRKDLHKEYNISKNIDLRNMLSAQYNFFQDQENKRDFKDHLGSILINLSKDHEIFFATYTFKDTSVEIPYERYQNFFDMLCERLDSKLLSNPEAKRTRTKLVFFPERPEHLAIEGKHACKHFHGFILVHKNYSKKFVKKCISDITDENTAAGIKENYILNEEVLNPYPKKVMEDYNRFDAYNRYTDPKTTLLFVQETRIYPIKSILQYFAVGAYGMKELQGLHVFYDDIIISCRI